MKTLSSGKDIRTFFKGMIGFALLGLIVWSPAADAIQSEARSPERTFTISNEKVSLTVVTDSLRLLKDELSTTRTWSKSVGKSPVALVTDAGFMLDIMWTDWQAPGKINNADNPATLTKDDFHLTDIRKKTSDSTDEIVIHMKGNDSPLDLRIIYKLSKGDFYARRSISVRDTVYGLHFLRWIWSRDGEVRGRLNLIKTGGFGQPIAFTTGDGGGFIGLEFPTSQNLVESRGPDGFAFRCGQEFGEKIGREWIASDWVVEGITPDDYVKLWFMKYVSRIRVAPALPYTLYNSWYDLRSPEYPGVPKDHVMNQENIARIIKLLDENMIMKHDIRLNAFVLDDGWDVYKSDWVLRKEQFPEGLKPIVDELGKTDTKLGLWFSPIGGYSFRNLRVGWMKAHGYETVGDEMCLAGKNYSRLFGKRVTDFAKDDGVSYYKWDGIQFSCSEPDHGHPVGIYSRRAVMETVINLCRAVRRVNPDIYLNITSGTWLSPWWVMYANQIWMQGGDYGYADVPSISPRDAAMTYRDLVLYEDFRRDSLWFPIANLMTHGIIKGDLEKLGGEEEPLDKFTNECVLYFARGISMWELYVSPDLLTEGEWNAISQSIKWARNRFHVLSNTEMVGGDPLKRETYGYVHFSGDSGIIAARNPWIASGSLKVKLSPAYGLGQDAKSLVLEEVYPRHWISPRLLTAGSTVDIPLEGYETAIYEIYPIMNATRPLPAGMVFDVEGGKADGTSRYLFYGKRGEVRLLNPHLVKEIRQDGSDVTLQEIADRLEKGTEPVVPGSVHILRMAGDSSLKIDFSVDSSVARATLAILLQPDSTSVPVKVPTVRATFDGTDAAVSPGQEGGPARWYTIEVGPGKHTVTATVSATDKRIWQGNAATWLICHQREKAIEADLRPAGSYKMPPMPPDPLPEGVVVRNVRLGEETLTTKN